MVDEMANLALIECTLASEDSTEVERELAERLQYAIDKIDRLVQAVKKLEVANGSHTGG